MYMYVSNNSQLAEMYIFIGQEHVNKFKQTAYIYAGQ